MKPYAFTRDHREEVFNEFIVLTFYIQVGLLLDVRNDNRLIGNNLGLAIFCFITFSFFKVIFLWMRRTIRTHRVKKRAKRKFLREQRKQYRAF